MTTVLVFVGGMTLAAALAGWLIMVLRPHLDRLLREVCGSEARAGFWAVTSLVTIGLVTFLFSTLVVYPEGDPSARDLFFALVGQLRAELVGLLASMMVVAGVLVSAIRRFERRLDPAQPARLNPYAPLPPPPTAGQP
ncbi:MAG: hypothetical protein ACR2MY_08115 [Candidatus Dormibacteria bacterium]